MEKVISCKINYFPIHSIYLLIELLFTWKVLKRRIEIAIDGTKESDTKRQCG